MDLGGGGGVPYVLLVLLAMWASRARYLLAAAVTGTLLTLLGFFYFPTDEEFLKIMVNRGESLLALWATALVCLLYKKKKEAYSSLQKNIELVNDNLPALVAY
ncbi:MAG: hypothetical protein GWM98_26390, partial [Nitrospinaceae bacterium]|nr:hypothetical protein [Nitrospinaceae bacterium]NIR57355.1 hypothetical protein [Nitrospinaceae bacterium]NIS87807.1 hypothetical protein [Nitrospinaceae bacterium]NIT84677.1 hypothetical protein [Nitrospinaceae bacterium]NIU46856.1 hypothetical protein [Nitrospinaceae bacterium]